MVSNRLFNNGILINFGYFNFGSTTLGAAKEKSYTVTLPYSYTLFCNGVYTNDRNASCTVGIVPTLTDITCYMINKNNSNPTTIWAFYWLTIGT